MRIAIRFRHGRPGSPSGTSPCPAAQPSYSVTSRRSFGWTCPWIVARQREANRRDAPRLQGFVSVSRQWPRRWCQNPAMADLDALKIPQATRQLAEEIIEITDGICGKM